jgi:hypothetical protein
MLENLPTSGVGEVAEPRGVGIVAERGVQEDRARPDLGIAAEGGIRDARALVDERLFAEVLRHDAVPCLRVKSRGM